VVAALAGVGHRPVQTVGNPLLSGAPRPPRCARWRCQHSLYRYLSDVMPTFS